MKVFGIGFHKTGTTTLESALSILGYRVCGPNRGLASALQKGKMDDVWKLVSQHDAFQDNPWPLLYRELDQRYPKSKFILTNRDSDKWIASMVNHFGSRSSEMRRWIYGSEYGMPKGNEQVYLDRYYSHYQAVLSYFKNRNDLLEVDFSKGDSWDQLCPFLGREIPDEPFPHSNKRSYSKTLQWLKKIGIR